MESLRNGIVLGASPLRQRPTLVIASGNPSKVSEISAMLAPLMWW